MKNLDTIGLDLFQKIRGRFSDVTLGDSDGNVTNVPEAARFFDFSFKVNGKDLGKVSVSIDENNGLVVIVGKDLVQNTDPIVKKSWYSFLKELRLFAKKRLLTFDVRDINKSNLHKRDYKFLAANRPGETPMAESSMYGTNKTSYQRIGNARMAIKHSQPINVESVGGRSQKIGSIYIESPEGERFKYPFKHLAGARAMARHVSEGGNAYDDFGKYITGLSEEIAKLQKFKTYMNRGGVMAETLSGYIDHVNERITTVKKEIQHLQKESFYKEAVSNFTAPVVEDVPDDVAENWIEQLTIKQFNEELKDVFPYIYRLVSEVTKAETVGPEDIVAEGDDPCWKNYKQIGMKKKGGREVPNCVPKEEIELENAFENLMGQFGEATPNNRSYPTMNDNELIAAYEMHKNQYRVNKLSNKTGMMYTHKLAMDEIKAELEKRGSSVGESDNNFTGDDLAQLQKIKDVDMLKAKAIELISTNSKRPMKPEKVAWFKKAIDSKRTPHDVIKLMYDLMLSGDGMGVIGSRDSMAQNSYRKKFGEQEPPTDSTKSPLSEPPKIGVADFILSYFDRETGKFPKGETAVLTAVQKDYGDKFVKPAAEFIKKIESMVSMKQAEQMQQSRYPQTEIIKHLAGL